MALPNMRIIARIIALGSMTLLMPGCVQLTFAWADLKPKGETASPPLLEAIGDNPAITSIDEWEANRAPVLRAQLEDHVFGKMPDASASRVMSRALLNESAFGNKAILEEWRIEASATFNGETVTTRNIRGDGFIVEIALPKDATGPVPIVLMETFCPRWNVMPDPAVEQPADADDISGGVFGGIATYVFGRYICTPPIEEILDRGYALAAIYPGEVVPDAGEAGLAELARLSAGYPDDNTRWGAVAAWGWVFSRVVDALEDDPRFSKDGMIVWGHSRYGKAALVAAAYDERIDGVISHQSGTGGASLNRRKPGESISSITKSYPHWFAQSYRAHGEDDAMSMPVDQHALLALIAPRPVLLGNARRDVWSDPNGAFRASLGANPAYALYGSAGLTTSRLDAFDPTADLSFWIRPGTHGVVEEDWPAFLRFMDAHFKDQGS